MTQLAENPIDLISFDSSTLNSFMPMHLRLNKDTKIIAIGRSLRKILTDQVIGRPFDQIFSVLHPHRFSFQSGKFSQPIVMKLSYGSNSKVPFHALLSSEPSGDGYFLNLSLGISLVEMRDHFQLTAQDFAPTDASIDLLYMVALQDAQVSECKRLTQRFYDDRNVAQKTATQDPLTGLSNRRFLEEYLASTHDRQSLLPYAFLLIDLDYFKTINDQMGHLVGDAVLRIVAKRLRAATRSSDIVARIGGDEFAMVLHGHSDPERIKSLAKRILQSISQPISFKDKTANISASIGARCIMNALHYDQLIPEVDEMLYDAKAKGRGRVQIFVKDAA